MPHAPFVDMGRGVALGGGFVEEALSTAALGDDVEVEEALSAAALDEGVCEGEDDTGALPPHTP